MRGKRWIASLLAVAVAVGSTMGSALALTGTDGKQPQSAAGGEAGSAIGASDWPQFRGTSLLSGVTDAKTPYDPTKTKQLWNVGFGSSGWWANTPSQPIIVGDSVYTLVASAKKLYRLSKEDGSVLAEADCPGSGQFFSQLAAADGKIFVPRAMDEQTDEGRKSYAALVAYDATTLDQLWVSEPIGGKDLYLQPLSPIICYDGYLYTGVSDAKAENGLFACYSTADEDPAKPDEVKKPTWTYAPQEGSTAYYWSGAAITAANTVVFGGEDGTLVSHALGEGGVIDTLPIGGAVRCTAHYDRQTGRVYVSTKSGEIVSVKLNPDGTFDRSSLVSKFLRQDLTSSPVSYRGRLYLSTGGVSSGKGFFVLDADTLEVIYKDEEAFQSQSSPMLTTAYATEENDYTVYLYVTRFFGYESGGMHPDSSCVYVIKDSQTTTELTYEKLVVPSVLEHCSQSVSIDADGSIYYYNDSGNLFKFGHQNPEDGVYTAQDVDNAIAQLPAAEALTLGDEPALNRVQARFDGLAEAQQQAVAARGRLEQLAAAMKVLRDESVQIPALIDDIGKLPAAEAITLDDEAAVKSLQERYNALSDKGKAQVSNFAVLEAAIEKITALKNAGYAADIDKQIEALPALEALTSADLGKVELLRQSYESLSAEVKALVGKADLLTAAYNRVRALDTEVKALGQAIWDEIKPMEVSLADQTVIETLEQRLAALPAADREKVEYTDDLAYARRVIDALGRGVAPAELFELLGGSEQTYTIPGTTKDGKAYTISFRGDQLTGALDFAYGLEAGKPAAFTSSEEAKTVAAAVDRLGVDPLLLRFAHSGALPGPATVRLESGLADGTYTLYAYHPQTGKAEASGQVTVTGGVAQFTLNHCSDYFIAKTLRTLPDTDEEENENRPTPNGGEPTADPADPGDTTEPAEQPDVTPGNGGIDQTGEPNPMPAFILLLTAGTAILLLRRKVRAD